MSAATSHAAATYQRGPTNGATCGLLRENDNAVESAEIDRRREHRGLVKQRTAALHVGYRADWNARMKRAAFTGDDHVAVAKRCILLDVFDRHAGEIAARDAPPTAAAYDRRNAARIIGDEQNGAGQRGYRIDASDD